VHINVSLSQHRDPAQVSHSIADILRERVFAIACGGPDGNDLDALRADAAFKMACGRLPDRGADLASQPTLSRLENTPDLRALIRLSHEMVDLWCRSHASAPKTIMLRCTAISSCRCSMLITMSGAFCRSMCTTPTPAVAW
jgi:hypothetical protein